MPDKFEIMHEVRKGLDGLKVDRTADRTEWTSAIKTELCRIGRCKFGCKVGALKSDVREVDYGEWLYDVTWLEYGCGGRLVDAHLVAECEWGAFDDIYDDFEKLLLARASVRLMVFDGNPKPDNNLWPGSTKIAERFANAIREFNGSRAEDAWLLAAWEKKLEWNEGEYERAWRFRYFTIETNTAIVHPLSRE